MLWWVGVVGKVTAGYADGAGSIPALGRVRYRRRPDLSGSVWFTIPITVPFFTFPNYTVQRCVLPHFLVCITSTRLNAKAGVVHCWLLTFLFGHF